MRVLRPKAKLSPDEVREIRAACAARSVTQDELARRYGVSRPTIGDIVNRRTWKNVTDQPPPPPSRPH